jgi:hypothetical protein
MIKMIILKISATISTLVVFTLVSASSFATTTAVVSEGEADASSQSATKTLEKIIRRATPADAVTRLVVERNIPVTYEYVSTLMRIPNAFGEGAACVVCHASNNPEKAYRGLNLSTCEGMIRGATEAPARGLAVVPGDPEKSLIVRFLRNNRMPMGIAFDYPIDGKPILAIKKWIDDGAKNDEFFNGEVLPLFAARRAFGIFAACTDCHMSDSEPPSFNGLNLTSYEGVMDGAHTAVRIKSGMPPRKIVTPGDSDSSPLYQRLTQNRMPAGVNPSETRDHPNVRLLMRWIEQGANCD